jgi:predicted ATP-grasp superfamily ATP-dependent carboligase
MQLVKTMELPLVAYFTSPDIPVCCTLHSEQLSYPARVYGNKKVVVFVCEFQLEDSVVPNMVDAIYDFAKRHNSPMIYSVEGKPVSDK